MDFNDENVHALVLIRLLLLEVVYTLTHNVNVYYNDKPFTTVRGAKSGEVEKWYLFYRNLYI